MAPSVLLLLLFILVQVRAIRQTTDVTDVSINLHAVDAGDSHAAGEAQIKVRKQHAIAGHTSLNTMTVYSLQADEGECRDPIKKITDFAKEQQSLSPQAGRSVDKKVDAAWLHDRGSGQKKLSEAFAVLDQSDLRDVMQTNEVWTLDDQDTLIKCETKETIRVEEETKTDNGSELLEGDMMAEPDGKPRSLLELKTLIQKGASWAGETWPKDHQGKTIVAYCFDPDLHEEARNAFSKAIEHTESQIPCLQFSDVGYNDESEHPENIINKEAQVYKSKPKSCSIIPSVKVQNSDPKKCWSHVGMQSSFFSRGESQPLNLGYPCSTMGVAAHELGHTLGMLHEQSRWDRDAYVVVHWDNIPPEKDHNFEKQLESWEHLAYDPLSLMQYEPKAFAINLELPTITAINPKGTKLLGQRIGWSQQDIIELGSKYCAATESYKEKDLLALPVRPIIKQEAILNRLVGQHQYIRGETKIINPLTIYNGHHTSCLSFVRCDGYSRTLSENWCGKQENTPGFQSCQWCKVTNICKGRVRISCPEIVAILSPEQSAEASDPKQVKLIAALNVPMSEKDDYHFCTLASESAHDAVEQGLVGSSVEDLLSDTDLSHTDHDCIKGTSCKRYFGLDDDDDDIDPSMGTEWCKLSNLCGRNVRVSCKDELVFLTPGRTVDDENILDLFNQNLCTFNML